MHTLRHVTDQEPGITRRRTGAGFTYVHADGRPVRDAATRDRIRAIVIPPAWRDVWICPTAGGHIQATGRDARGRKQYRYHPQWIAARDEAKYDHMLDFAEALPRIRRRVEHDIHAPARSRPRVLATVVRLLERTLIRIGNDEYARANGSYGLTTLHNHHVRVRGSHLAFKFRAKSGILQHVDLNDPLLAGTVKTLQELPGQLLFQYVDASGATQRIDSADVNEYLRDIAGRDFTAKDVRTWFGTVLAAMALSRIGGAHRDEGSRTSRKRHVAAAIDQVKDALGNTRAVCRKCYVHPAVIDAYLEGHPVACDGWGTGASANRGLTPPEHAVLDFLRHRTRKRVARVPRHTRNVGIAV